MRIAMPVAGRDFDPSEVEVTWAIPYLESTVLHAFVADAGARDSAAVGR